MSGRVHRCEWGRCANVASSKVKRGVYMPFIRVCELHLQWFYRLTDVEAWKVFHARQATRAWDVGDEAVKASLGWVASDEGIGR